MNGQAAIVTGGARGIGLAMARHLAEQRGCRVAIWDRDVTIADEAFKPAFAQAVDVTDPDALAAAFEATVAALGDISILICNAGINGPVAPMTEYTVEDWRRVMAVDLDGVFYSSRVVIPHMVARGYGRVVITSSISGKEGNPNVAAYSAAKAGVIGFAKSVAKEVATTGVTVNCIAPGITITDLLKEMTPEHVEMVRSKIPMNRFCTVDEIAAMVGFIASPECSFTTGAVFDLTGGRGTY